MSETKFTPGPWKVEIGNNCAFAIFAKSKRGLSKRVGMVGGFFRDQRQQNADLIAAAPELFEALAGLLSAEERKTPEYRLPEPLLDEARAALAKARGETP